MKKRILSLLCVLCLLLTMLPTSAFAAGYDAPTLSIEASYDSASNKVTAKVILGACSDLGGLDFHMKYDLDKLAVESIVGNEEFGSEDYTTISDNTATTKDIGLSFVKTSGMTVTGTKLVFTATFSVKPGQTGDAQFSFDDYYTNFAHKNGDDAASTPAAGSVTTTTVTIPKAPISSVTASVDAPVKGKELDTTVDIGAATGYTSKVEWYKGNTATGTAVTGPAAANQVYTAKITLTASSGERFAKGVTTPTGYTKVSANATTIVLTKTFPATAEKTLTGITIDSAPTKTEYTVGEKFETKGMTIKATYDDSTHAIVTDTSKFTVMPEGTLTMTDTKVTVSYAEGGVTKKAEQIITVKAKALTDAMVSLDKGGYAYTGSQIQPTVTVKDGATTLKKDTDYTVTYGANNTVGTKVGTVTITGKGDYSGTIEKKFNITAKALTANMVQPIASQPYTGSAIEPTVTVNVGKKTLTAGTDYTVTYKDNTNVGTAKVIVTGKGNYTGSVEAKFNITAKALTASMVRDIAAQTYTGSPIVPELTVKDGETALSKDTDYTVKYQNNLNAGTATVTLTGKGNYSDSVSKTFTIKQKYVTAQRDATDIQVVVDKGTFDAPTFGDVKGTLTYSYDGATSYDAIVKKLKTLQLGATGDIGYTYTATANGNYTGTITGTLHFTVVNLPAATITTAPAAKTGLTFNGTEQVLVNAGSGITGGTLQYKLDGGSYNAELPKATNAGSYTVYYKVKGNNTTHSDSSEQSFTVTIAPKTVTAAVSVEPTSYTYTGEAIVPTTVTVKDGTTVIPASEYTVAYTDNTNVGTATVTVSDRAGGNYVVSGTATFTITKAALSGVSVSLGGWTYGDTAKTPTVSGNLGNANVTYQYKAADAADETYTNVVPTNAGTYTVKATVAESANYAAATATRNFTIVPKAISKAIVENIGEQEFTGRTITPTVTVKDGTVVLTDADYSVAYANNIDAGTANVTITGKGNYTGSTSVKFTIAQAAAPVVVDDSGATVTAPDTTKENVAGKLDETGKTKYNKDSKGEVTTDEEIILGNVKKAMGVTGTNSTMITAQVTTSGSATKAMTVLPYAQGADSRKNFTVKKLNADGTIETIDSRNVVKMAAGLKLELEDGAIYAISWRTPSSSGSGSSYTSGQSFTTDLPADSINRVTVNGKKLDSKYYTVSSNGSGSIVTLTDAYLATLKAGKYTVKIENKTHVSTGTFTIKADGTLSSPRTADAGVCIYAAMALMSGTGAAYVTLRRKKEN